ncbi:MAG TPA: Na-translocating system protein MpsC family protein, partial [Solirubrobacterales bacterium]
QSMTESNPLAGGELNAALTREVVRIHTANLGRGPNKSFSFHNGNVVVTVLQEVLTKAEQSLAVNEQGEAVLAMRQLFQRTMAEEMKASVERLTGCKVVAFMSDNHLEPDMAVEVFILDTPVT